MMDFGALIRLQKKLPPDCPIRLTPFINDPLAFIGEKDLDREAQELKSALSTKCADDPALAEALKKIDENLVFIHRAEAAVAKLKLDAEKVFPGFECGARGALYQTERDISNTLWAEAFKMIGGAEVTFQMHVLFDGNTTWAQVLVLAKGPDAVLKKAVKHACVGDWEFKEMKGPENQAYVAEKKIALCEKAVDTMKAGMAVIAEIEKRTADN